MMKANLFFTILPAGLFAAIAAIAQDYEIKKATERINGRKYAGVSSLVSGPQEKVEAHWLDFVRQHGKVRRKHNYYQITGFRFRQHTSDTLTYATRVISRDSLGLIWIAPLADGLDDDLREKALKGLQEVLLEGTRSYYVAEIQAKIDQSEAAARVMSRKHQKLLYEGETLATDLQAARELKAELEARLEQTILKIKSLNQQILDNQEAVEQAYADLEKIKMVIERHKEALRKVK